MSVRFSASNQVLSTTTGLPGTTFTITMWVYEVNTKVGDYAAFFDLPATTGASASTWQYMGLKPAAPRLIMAVEPGQDSAGFAHTTGAWFRVALVRSGTSFTFYRAPDTGSITSETMTASGPTPAKMYLGGDSYSTEWFDGRIGALKMWSAALTAGEIDGEFTSFTAVRTSNLIRECTLKTTTADTSGNGYTWTAGAGAVTFEADPPILVLPTSQPYTARRRAANY